MPVIDPAEFEQDAIEMEGDMPVSTRINCLIYPAAVDLTESGLRMAEAGYDTQRRTRIVYRQSVFAAVGLPTTNDEIEIISGLNGFDGTTWRISDAPEFSHDGINVTFPLTEVT